MSELSPAEAASRAGERLDALYHALQRGEVRARKNAKGQWRISPDAMDAYLADRAGKLSARAAKLEERRARLHSSAALRD